MDTNLQNTTTITTFTNLEKMETNEHNITVHHQNLVGSGIWPNYHIPSSTSGAVPSNSGFVNVDTHFEEEEEPDEELGAMKEMMYKIAAMQPVDIDPASIRKPKRRNVRISDDPQSVAARHRRERISEKMRILQRLVPGGTKMDTASMLDEAIRYVKFLKRQIRLLQSTPAPQYSQPQPPKCNIATPTSTPSATFLLPTTGGYWPLAPNILHGGDGSSSSTFNHHEYQLPKRNVGF